MHLSQVHQPSKRCISCSGRCSPTEFTEFTEHTGRGCSPTEFTEFTEQTGRDVLPQNSQNSQNRLAEDVLPQISQILTDGVCLEFCEFCVFCGTSHAPVNLCKSVQSVGGLFWLRGVYPPTEQTGRDVLPQISQILTDGVCLEFCEFCVFCGTSHAPVNLCKSVQSVGGLFWLRGVYPPTEQTGRDVLPQNSQILTDGACLEFCEFCVFCGTSYAPSESV